MLREQLAPLVAGICRRWDLPAVWLSAADLLAGRAGVTDHNTVNEAYRASDHWDCGPSFPAGLLMELVRAELGETTAGPAQAEQEYEMRACEMNDGQILLVDGMEYQVLSEGRPWDEINAILIELGRAGLIPTRDGGVPVIEKIGDNAVNALRKVGE